ncbi:MAG TPA: chorismate synthase, partial [Gammaproteobacteria bacterium]|nr:chorismate synthase [Gammaproteobacteria bacterium]
AKQVLKAQFGVEIRGCMYQMGSLKVSQYNWDEVSNNPFFCPDPELVPQLEALIHEIRKAGSSIGAGVMVQATGVPVGWGEPVFDRLDADIAKAMMSINAVK